MKSPLVWQYDTDGYWTAYYKKHVVGIVNYSPFGNYWLSTVGTTDSIKNDNLQSAMNHVEIAGPRSLLARKLMTQREYHAFTS